MCLRDFELFLRGSLSQPNILSIGFTTALSHPPLCCSDWLRDIEERETQKKRERESGRAFLFLGLQTIGERPGREENASTPLTPLAPAHSTLNQLNQPLFSGSCLTRNYWSSIVDWTTLSWPWGCRCSVFWGDVLTGAGPEDPWLSGADCLAPLQV